MASFALSFNHPCSNEVLLGVEIVIVVACRITDDIVELDAVAEESANATETLDELETVR